MKTDYLVPDWRPTRFAAADPRDRALVARLVSSGGVSVHDRLREQLDDLIEARHPGPDGAARRAPEAERILAGRPLDRFGEWFHFPWSAQLVHVLPEALFVELRGDRNRYRITADERGRLRAVRVAVIGLSVGRAIAETMALEGVGGHFRLADPDTLALSNLNRLRAPLWELGVNKAALAARSLLAVDPYLSLQVHENGVTDESLDDLLRGDGGVDVVVEECDDLAMKVAIRERARRLGIPVVMATSERGLLDIERFDREPLRPVFHGLAGELSAAELRGLSAADKVPVVLRMLGEENLSDRTLASLLEIDGSLASWPQTASAVALGGAMVCDAVRRIVLGTLTESGRFSVDLSALVSDGAGLALRAWTPRADVPELPGALHLPSKATSAAAVVLDDDQRRTLTHAATLAPSGGNMQPWRWLWTGSQLKAELDLSRCGSFLDYELAGAHLAMGAAAENLRIAATALGLRADITHRAVDSPSDFAFHADFHAFSAPRDPLSGWLDKRCTNRRRVHGEAPSAEALGAVADAAAERGGRVLWAGSPDAIEALANMLAEGDRLRFLHQTMHRELIEELRWSSDEAAQTRDGLDVATLELTPGERAGLGLIRHWRAMRVLGGLGAGGELGKLSRKAMRCAGAVGLVTVPKRAGGSFFAGGQAVQRAWLAATAAGLAFQPMSAITYVWLRIHGGGDGLLPEHQAGYEALRATFEQVFAVADGWQDIMMFRVFRGPPPSARSLRRPLQDVLTIERSRTAS